MVCEQAIGSKDYATAPPFFVHGHLHIQLFREKLSEKVHAIIPKGIVRNFEFAVLQRNLIEWHERPWTYVCKC